MVLTRPHEPGRNPDANHLDRRDAEFILMGLADS